MHENIGLGIIISGPSGVGKGTVIKALIEKEADLALSTSYSTRAPRGNEVNGTDYFFVSVDAFNKKIANNEFAEWALVHGNFYGTDKSVLENIKSGKKIIFEIDVQGAKNLIKTFNSTQTNYISFFLLPPSMKELEQRLENRGTENKKSVEIRMDNAKKELEDSSCFNYTLVNDKIEDTTKEILSFITGKKEK
ncbi:MAG: guanylate kinase [Candidatus Margulisbacteria bacterium GWF2_35_9]|nr:MAG: guanylate kinase [Candidatus Margulisbacteria bacterium GWF2_35_9]